MDDPIGDFKRWYFKQPLVTRTYLTVCFLLAVLINLNAIVYYDLNYVFSYSFFYLQLWRPFTGFFFLGGFGFSWFFDAYFAYLALSKVQSEIFGKETQVDFLWLCVLMYSWCLIAASIFTIEFFGDCFIFAFLYIWCKRRPFEIIRLFFGFQVKSGYFPWFYMAFQVLTGQSFLIYLIGLLFGHLYIIVKDVYLTRYRKDYLPTPNFFKNWWLDRREVPNQFRYGQRSRQAFGGVGMRIG